LDAGKARALVFTSVGHFVNDGSVFFVPLIADLLAASKGFSPTEVAMILFVYYSLSTISSVYVGRVSSKSGEMGKLVAVGIALLGAGLLGFDAALIYVEGVALLLLSIALAALMGFGSAFYHPLGAAILQNSFGNATGGRALGANGALGSIGRALYPSLFFVAALALTQSGAMAALGVVAVVSAVVLWFGLGVFRSQSREGEGNGGGGRGLLSPAMIALALLTFLRTASMFGVAAWIPEYLTFKEGLGVSTNLGFVLSAMFAAAIVGQPFFGVLLDRFDRRLIFLGSSVGAALSAGALTRVGGPTSIVLLVIFGFFVYTGFPVLLSLASDYIPKGSEVMGNAVIWGLGQTGGNAAGALIIGAIVLNDYSRLDVAFQAMVAVAIVTAFFVMLIPGRKTADQKQGAG
jgi:MFS transporter, FSR family, fosmidomycin resistance protein